MKIIFLLPMLLFFVFINSFSKKEKNVIGKQSTKFKIQTTAPTLSIGNASIAEGNGGQRTIEITVILSQPSPTPVRVEYKTKAGSASEGADYVAASGTLTFAPGEIMKKISITVNGGKGCEANEAFEVVLSKSSGAAITRSSGKVY